MKRIREIKTFENKDALMKQISLDTKNCEKVFANSLNELEIKKFFDKFMKVYYGNKNFEPEIIDIKSCL